MATVFSLASRARCVLFDTRSHPLTLTSPPSAATSATNATRLPYADAMRTLAIFAVVLIHTHVNFGPALHRTGGPIANVIVAAAHWCVPVFVMLSGALLLDPAREESLGRFYRRRLLRVGLPTLLWSAFYIQWRQHYLGHSGLHGQQLWREVMRGEPSYHMYFLFIVLGLYVFTPFLRSWVRHAPRGQVVLGAWLALGVCCAWCVYYGLRGIGQWYMPARPNVLTLFAPYLGYFLLGYVLRDVRVRGGGLWLAITVWLGCVAGSAIGFAWLVNAQDSDRMAQRWFFAYLSPGIVVMSIASFLLIARAFAVRRPWWVQWINARSLGGATFGIYLMHIALLDVLRHEGWVWWAYRHWHLRGRGVLVLVALSVVVMAAGFAITWCVQRVPGVRRILG